MSLSKQNITAFTVVKRISALKAGFKPQVLLALVPVLISASIGLTACGDNKIVVPSSDSGMVSTKVTMGSGETVYPNDDPSVPDGGDVYKSQNCASCHGDGGKPSGAGVTSDFSSKDWGRKQKPVEQFDFIEKAMKNGKEIPGHPKMQGVLRTSQIWNLVFYVRSLSTQPLTDTEISEVLPVFGANCAVCHGTKGYGNGPLMKGNVLEPAPANFQSFPRFYDRDDDTLWDHIANGIKWEGMPNFLGKTDKAKNITFDRDYIYKLVGYVRHFHESNKTEAATKAAHEKEDKEEKQPDNQPKDSSKPQT
jgi:mono/diheme cytochrome c family protein